jgi:hypothetical protein
MFAADGAQFTQALAKHTPADVVALVDERPPPMVWTDGAGTRVEVIELLTQRGRIVAYKITRGALRLSNYQSLEGPGQGGRPGRARRTLTRIVALEADTHDLHAGINPTCCGPVRLEPSMLRALRRLLRATQIDHYVCGRT